jgi:benzoate transport
MTSARSIVENGPMHVRQWIAVALTILLNALDGFDVLSSAFAGPGIKAEWNLRPDGLGLVLSMELIGMGFGSILLGGMADRIGRRPTTLICLVTMATGMFMATTAQSPQMLSVWRLLTGIGIGGMLAAINALTRELCNAKWRSFAMALMVIGYPLGAFGGGLVARELLKDGDWRAVFEFGAIMTGIMIPLVWFLVPETPEYLDQARPANALARINAVLGRFALAPLAALGERAASYRKASLASIFKPDLIRATLALSLGYTCHAMTFYFVLKMAPVIISDPQYAGQHFTPGQGAGVLAYANLGGAVGGAVFGWFMHRFGIKRSTIAALLGSAIVVIWFGTGQTTLDGWIMAVFAVGLFTNAAIVGFYSAFAAAFPTHARATGTGFAIGVGRAGSALSPILSGILFQSGVGLQGVAIVMALGSLLSIVMLASLRLEERTAAAN